MKIVIRPATAADAEAVHEIIVLALRETNARDYPSSVIGRLVLTLPEDRAGVAGRFNRIERVRGSQSPPPHAS